MKQVIIHAGFPKTATTSIQKTCAKNRIKLEELGFHYPLFYINKKTFTNHSFPLHTIFANHPNLAKVQVKSGLEVDFNEVQQVCEQQLDEILQKNLKTIVLSAENLSLFTKSEISKMVDKIQLYGYDIRVIILVRSPFSYLNSWIQQMIKSGKSSIDKQTYKFAIKEKIEKMISIFPKAEFYSFHRACQHKNGPVGYFLNLVGVNNYSEIEFVENNTSISNQSTRLISYINEKQPLYINNKVNPLRSKGDTLVFNHIKGNKFKLSNNEIEKFRHGLDEDNKYLLEEFGGEFCDPNPYLPLEENNNYWSEEQMEQLKIAISKIDDNLFLKETTYDYFKNVIKFDQQKISYLGFTNCYF